MKKTQIRREPKAPQQGAEMRLPMVPAEMNLFDFLGAAKACQEALDVDALLMRIRNLAIAAICQRSNVDNLRFKVTGIEPGHLVITPIQEQK